MNTSKKSCQCGQCQTPSQPSKKTGIINFLMAILYVLFPKCAICWAAYASFFSYLGLGQLEYNPHFQTIILMALGVGSTFVLLRHVTKKAWLNVALFLSALVLMIIAKRANVESWLIIIVIGVLMLLSQFHFQGFKKEEMGSFS